MSKTDLKTEDLLRDVGELDRTILSCLVERAGLQKELDGRYPVSQSAESWLRLDLEAEVMRTLVEQHSGLLAITSAEHIWRLLLCDGLPDLTIHLDSSTDLLSMVDLARFHFGFHGELVQAGDASDVVSAVAAGLRDVGLIGLEDRAVLPWWRGLGLNGAEIVARLPFLVLDQRPADIPGFVIAPSAALAEESSRGRDTLVYDARWSGTLPGKLMNEGLEVVSFHRSADGVDALLAVSADMSEEDVLAACRTAGAKPGVLRMVGGYFAPIDVEGDTDDDFGTAFVEG